MTAPETWSLVPGRSLGPFSLGSTLNECLYQVQNLRPAVHFSFTYCREDPLASDLYIALPECGITLRVDAINHTLIAIIIHHFAGSRVIECLGVYLSPDSLATPSLSQKLGPGCYVEAVSAALLHRLFAPFEPPPRELIPNSHSSNTISPQSLLSSSSTSSSTSSTLSSSQTDRSDNTGALSSFRVIAPSKNSQENTEGLSILYAGVTLSIHPKQVSEGDEAVPTLILTSLLNDYIPTHMASRGSRQVDAFQRQLHLNRNNKTTSTNPWVILHLGHGIYILDSSKKPSTNALTSSATNTSVTDCTSQAVANLSCSSHLPPSAVHLRQLNSVQELLTELGPPSYIATGDPHDYTAVTNLLDSLLLSTMPSASLTSSNVPTATFTKPYSEYILSYSSLGLSFSFDARTHRLLKCLLFTNLPGHPSFTHFSRAQFAIFPMTTDHNTVTRCASYLASTTSLWSPEIIDNYLTSHHTQDQPSTQNESKQDANRLNSSKLNAASGGTGADGHEDVTDSAPKHNAVDFVLSKCVLWCSNRQHIDHVFEISKDKSRDANCKATEDAIHTSPLYLSRGTSGMTGGVLGASGQSSFENPSNVDNLTSVALKGMIDDVVEGKSTFDPTELVTKQGVVFECTQPQHLALIDPKAPSTNSSNYLKPSVAQLQRIAVVAATDF